MNTGHTMKTLVAGLLALTLVACAGQSVTPSDPERDPWEGYNRKVHNFNMGADRYVLRPVARGYDAVMPEAPQRGVRNFFRNLDYPVTFVNLLLQGKFVESMDATARFLVNSTIGLGGFFDVAGKAGMPFHDEDFGQTLGTWGWTDSRYVVMPFIGPYTVRDLVGRSFYGTFHPVSYAVREHDAYYLIALDIISLRAELLPLDEELATVNDPYALIRDVYLQNRTFDIYDGDPPLPDYDALLEDE